MSSRCHRVRFLLDRAAEAYPRYPGLSAKGLLPDHSGEKPGGRAGLHHPLTPDGTPIVWPDVAQQSLSKHRTQPGRLDHGLRLRSAADRPHQRKNPTICRCSAIYRVLRYHRRHYATRTPRVNIQGEVCHVQFSPPSIGRRYVIIWQ